MPMSNGEDDGEVESPLAFPIHLSTTEAPAAVSREYTGSIGSTAMPARMRKVVSPNSSWKASQSRFSGSFKDIMKDINIMETPTSLGLVSVPESRYRPKDRARPRSKLVTGRSTLAAASMASYEMMELASASGQIFGGRKSLAISRASREGSVRTITREGTCVSGLRGGSDGSKDDDEDEEDEEDEWAEKEVVRVLKQASEVRSQTPWPL